MPAATKTSPLGFRVGPKLAYTLKLAARERSTSVSAFVEQTLNAALLQPQEELADGSMDSPSHTAVQPRWEALWSEDEATRFYLLAHIRPDLMEPDQKRLWKLLGTRDGLPVSLQQFKAGWDDPMVDTTHLASEANNA